MGSLTAIRIQPADGSGDPEAPIAGLRDIGLVAELQHQFVAGLSILSQTKAAFRYALTEAKIWQRRSDDMERRPVAPGACE